MENQQNNNKGVITLLIVIIIILATLCVLFLTGTITLNTNKINDNNANEIVNDNNETMLNFDNIEIKNSEVKELYNYITASLNSNNVCLGYYYQNPFKKHNLDDLVSLVLINYGQDHIKTFNEEFLKEFNENDRNSIKTNSDHYIEANVIKQGMKKIFNIDISEFKEKTETNYYYSGYYYRKDVNAFINVFGGGGYGAEVVQKIIKYQELNDEINITVVKAELGYDDDHVYRYIYNKKTKVFENATDNFQFTNENIERFPQIKYVFKKNNTGQYYVSDIINLNFEEDFEECK